MIVEGANRTALGRALKGLQVRIARGLNAMFRRAGRVFADRYHARAMKTPRETRNAIAYVLLNSRRHAHQRGMRLPSDAIDPCSSGKAFDGWTKGRPAQTDPAAVAAPKSWLLTTGWRKWGLISLAVIR
jgi:hypothetical protein